MQKQKLLKMSESDCIVSTKTIVRSALFMCLFLFSTLSFAQTYAIRGEITDKSTLEPIISATIVEKGASSNGTLSDIDGKFTLSVEKGSYITISYIGYLTKEILVKDDTYLNIELEEDAQLLSEVVVVGFGTQKKVNLTGSVAAISSDVIENRPVTNTSSALQGLLPGVTIIQNSGQPGKDNGSINIRGVGTLNNSNPMYIIDGFVATSINDIDPNDIENISVLKDAASAAIYGSRAANGVILITTKKGLNQPAKIRYDGYLGWQNPTALPEYLGSAEYAGLLNKALKNEGKDPLYSSEEIDKFRDGSDPDLYPDTDWLGLFYRNNALQQSHRVEVSGGSDKSTYMFSAGYIGRDGVIDHAESARYNVRANVSTEINKLSAGVNFSYSHENIQEPSNPYTGDMYQIFRQINRIAPFVPYKYSNGHYGYTNDGSPMAWMESGSLRQEKFHNTRIVGNVGYEIIDGLKIQEVVGYEFVGRSDEKFVKDIQYYNWKTEQPSFYQGPNNQTDDREDYYLLNLQTLLTYDKSFGKHDLNLLAGYSQEYSRRDWTIGKRINFLNNDLWELDAGSKDGQISSGSANEYALQSFFGRLSYAYDNRYLFEMNIRRDGTSRIEKKSRWGTFPSFSAAWRIINESFMEGTRDYLSDLKIRAGWGRLGNQQLGTNPRDYIEFYPFQEVLSQSNYAFGGKVNSGVAPIKGSNSALRWETSESTNIGLDVGLLSNKLTLAIDLYKKNTYDILMKLPVSTLYGLEAPYQNAGAVQNKGIEAQATYKTMFKDWKFNVTANVAYNDNKVTNLQNNGAKIWDGFKFKQEGYPINTFGGYEVLGIFQTQDEVDKGAVINRTTAGPGDLKYRDVNKDGKIDGNDRVYLGSWLPKYTFGLNLSTEWKGIDASVFFQGAADVKGFLQNETVGLLRGNTSKPTALYRDSWDADTNPNGKFPRPLTTWNQNEAEANPSSFWVINSSYLRLKNIQVGYTLPQKWTSSVGIERVRLYYSGQNLLTFTSFNKGFDPEAPAGARAYYPQVKTNTFGLNITF